MKKLIFIILLIFSVTKSYTQVVCVIDGQSFTPSSKPLCTYQFASDTTDHLITSTYISVTKDSLYYADVLKYKTECTSLMIVKAALKDLKNDIGYQIQEFLLNEKTKLSGFLLTVYTSLGHNAFINYQASVKYGATQVNGNIMNVICATRSDAEALVNEIDKMVKAK